jgi:hypothetical protein
MRHAIDISDRDAAGANLHHGTGCVSVALIGVYELKERIQKISSQAVWRVMTRAPFLFLFVLFLSGCTMHGRLYNLDTGAKTIVTFSYSGSGNGPLTGALPSGEVMRACTQRLPTRLMVGVRFMG